MTRTLAPPMPRHERVRQILDLRARGLTNPQIAVALGVAVSTVRNSICDPDGSKQRERRRTYEGECVDCGATTKSDGTSKASDRCPSCSTKEHHPKVWTREAVIEAIQRFASIHGRPPIADEWLHVDEANGYPNRNSVYRSDKRSTSPFRTWTGALAVAGFPGLNSGRRTLKEVNPMEYDRKGYTVLREVEGHWEIVAESNEGTQVGALNAALNGGQPQGRWIAVPNRYWNPRALQPRTIYDWVEETTAA